MARRGPTSLETKEKQFEKFIRLIAIQGINAEHLKDPHRTYNPVYDSKRAVYDKFGADCLDLFRLMFIYYHRGGIDRDGNPFKTTWRYNKDIAEDVDFMLAKVKLEIITTAKEAVKCLEARGVKPLQNVLIRDANGFKQGYKLMTDEEYADYKKTAPKKPARKKPVIEPVGLVQ